jgi:hypothetical protein
VGLNLFTLTRVYSTNYTSNHILGVRIYRQQTETINALKIVSKDYRIVKGILAMIDDGETKFLESKGLPRPNLLTPKGERRKSL